MGWSTRRATGLTLHEPSRSFKGYTLLAPLAGDAAYLLDIDGRVVHRWRLPGFRIFQPRLLPTGTLLVLCADTSLPPPPQTPFTEPPPPFSQHVRRLGGNATHLLELDWGSAVVCEYRNEAIHHDFVRLENGNTLVLEWVELPPTLAARVKGGARRL